MSIFSLTPRHYSDVAYVEGVYQYDPIMERELHKLCKDYYDKNFHKPKVDEEGRKDIFQSSLLAVWDNIRNRRLFVKDGELKGKDGQPFISTLTTYFMAIVNNKYLEWLRKNPIVPPIAIKEDKVTEEYNDDDVLDGFAEGAKKALAPAVIVLLVYTVLVAVTYHPFQLVIYKALLGLVKGKFAWYSVFPTSLVAIIASVLNADPSYVFQSVLPYLVSLKIDTDLYGVIGIIFQSLYGLTVLVGPTSIVLLSVLSVLKISYLDWLKKIWKFALEFLAVLLIIFIILTLV